MRLLFTTYAAFALLPSVAYASLLRGGVFPFGKQVDEEGFSVRKLHSSDICDRDVKVYFSVTYDLVGSELDGSPCSGEECAEILDEFGQQFDQAYLYDENGVDAVAYIDARECDDDYSRRLSGDSRRRLRTYYSYRCYTCRRKNRDGYRRQLGDAMDIIEELHDKKLDENRRQLGGAIDIIEDLIDKDLPDIQMKVLKESDEIIKKKEELTDCRKLSALGADTMIHEADKLLADAALIQNVTEAMGDILYDDNMTVQEKAESADALLHSLIPVISQSCTSLSDSANYEALGNHEEPFKVLLDAEKECDKYTLDLLKLAQELDEILMVVLAEGTYEEIQKMAEELGEQETKLREHYVKLGVNKLKEAAEKLEGCKKDLFGIEEGSKVEKFEEAVGKVNDVLGELQQRSAELDGDEESEEDARKQLINAIEKIENELDKLVQAQREATKDFDAVSAKMNGRMAKLIDAMEDLDMIQDPEEFQAFLEKEVSEVLTDNLQAYIKQDPNRWPCLNKDVSIKVTTEYAEGNRDSCSHVSDIA